MCASGTTNYSSTIIRAEAKRCPCRRFHRCPVQARIWHVKVQPVRLSWRVEEIWAIVCTNTCCSITTCRPANWASALRMRMTSMSNSHSFSLFLSIAGDAADFEDERDDFSSVVQGFFLLDSLVFWWGAGYDCAIGIIASTAFSCNHFWPHRVSLDNLLFPSGWLCRHSSRFTIMVPSPNDSRSNDRRWTTSETMTGLVCGLFPPLLTSSIH